MLTLRIITLPTVVLLTAGGLAACGSGSDAAGTSEAAETSMSDGMDMEGMDSDSGGMSHASIECPGAPEVDAVPQAVVTMDTGAAAFLFELGVGDTVVGTSGTDFSEDFSGTLRKQLDGLKVLAGQAADRETVIALEPDLVTGISTYEFGGFDGTATVDQLAQNGAAALAACDTEDTGQVTGIDATYDYITQLAAIFDVADQGEALVAEMKQEVEQAAATTSAAVPVLSLTSVPDGGSGITTNAGGSMVNGIITLAGGENVAGDVSGDYADLSAEAVAAADPKVIIAASGLTDQTPAELVEAIKASPLLASTSAVKNNHVVAVPQTTLLSPSVLNPQAIATVAEAVEAAG